MSVRYRPGPMALVAVPAIALLTPDDAVALRAWELLDGLAGPTDLLQDLIRDGFVTLPPFVLVDATGDGVRVLVRGDARAEVDTGRETARWTGAGVSTWAERSFEQVTLVRVDAGETAVDPLPLRAGVVRCGGFEYRPATGPPPAAERQPVPGPVIESVPAAEPAPIVQQAAAPAVGPAVQPVAESGPDLPPEPGCTPDLAQTRTDDPEDGFDHLFESTIMRSVEDAAIREVVEDAAALDGAAEPADPAGAAEPAEPSEPPEPAEPSEPVEQGEPDPARIGDHDGRTIMSGDLDALREQTPNTDPIPSGASTDPATTARLELSTGDVVVLDRDVVIGRRPEVERVQGGRVPTVVTVPSPQQDVSRTHLRIGRSGEQVLATDLHSMNGTLLVGADGITRNLDGGAPHPLADGDTLDIGDGVTLTLRMP